MTKFNSYSYHITSLLSNSNYRRRHVALIILPQKQHKNIGNILTIGCNTSNKPWSSSPNLLSTHAEMNAISNLQKINYNQKKHKQIKIDLISVKICTSGTTCNARPCAVCLKYMLLYIPSNYIIKNIVYTITNNIIVVIPFIDFLQYQHLLVIPRPCNATDNRTDKNKSRNKLGIENNVIFIN